MNRDALEVPRWIWKVSQGYEYNAGYPLRTKKGNDRHISEYTNKNIYPQTLKNIRYPAFIPNKIRCAFVFGKANRVEAWRWKASEVTCTVAFHPLGMAVDDFD